MRSDAARNRRRVLAAARDLYAARGLDVATDEIARRAGVGKATVYRGFPTKLDLVGAVLEELVEQLEALAEAAADSSDPLDGVRRFLVDGAVIHRDNAAFLEATIDQLEEGWLTPELRERVLAACGRAIGRARAAGWISNDLAASDVAALIKMLAVSGPGSGRPDTPGGDQVTRYADLLINGIRPR